jgi:hypothetical protein
VFITQSASNPYKIRSQMMQPGFFDWQNRFEKLDKTGDPLLKLTTAIN